MPKKKDQSVLGLPPLPPPSPTFGGTGLVAYNAGRPASPREIGVWEELQVDKVIITAIDDKAHYGLEQMNELKWFAATDTFFTMRGIEDVRQEAQGTGCQGAMDEFCQYLTTLSARHTLGVIEVSAGKIAEVVAESVLPPPPPPAPAPKKGFLARLFGG